MRVLLAWELGANWGHARRLEALAAALLARGHEVHLAVQDLGPFRLTETHAGAKLWQAPVWSGLLRFAATRPLGAPRRFGDLLANLGLQSSAALVGLLRGWEALLDAIRPDLLMADFAPAALLAARGRLPRLAIGTGFTVPPADLAEFPAFPGEERPPLVEEAALLALVNEALEQLGLAPLAQLTEIQRAEVLAPAVFAELDPYRLHRKTAPLSPFLSAQIPGLGAHPEGIFAYLPGPDLTEAGLALLTRLGPQVTAVMPGLGRARRALLAEAGLRLMDRPLTWAEIAQHRAVLCNGGMGTVSQTLVTGLPLAVLPGGIEQELTARALQAWGLSIQPEALADPAELARARPRARALGQDFRARLADPALALAQAAEALLAQKWLTNPESD